MSFLLGFIVGVLFTIFAIIIWWYWDAGIVTGILDDDILMQRPASDWGEPNYDREEGQVGTPKETQDA